MLTVTSYAGARLAVRWGGVGQGGGEGAAVFLGRPESWWRGFALGTAALWFAFYVCLSLQLL
jgi:hypothetical protein